MSNTKALDPTPVTSKLPKTSIIMHDTSQCSDRTPADDDDWKLREDKSISGWSDVGQMIGAYPNTRAETAKQDIGR